MRCAATLFLVGLALAITVAPASAAGPPPAVELHEGWEFSRAPQGPWKQVTVPHVFDGSADAQLFQGTVGWYQLRFRGPATPRGWGWDLRFEGVRRRSEVFLNGRPIGRNDDPYAPFTLSANGLKPNAENVLIVRVDNRRERGFREGWWNWGGITRRVRLEPRGGVAVRDLGLLSRVDCSSICRATVLADGWITNYTSRPVRPRLAARLSAPDGGPSAQRTVRLRTVRPGETARVHFRVPVPGDPKLWAPERPYLYDATVQARIGKTVHDTMQQKVGLRTVRVRDGQLWLNGRRLDLRGASIQEDMPGRGPALTDEDVEQIVSDLKSVKANVTRAHYLLDERLLRRFDEEGILVWSQAPVYHRDVQLRTTAGRERELASVRRTVLNARSHPSVVTHSVANELSPQPDRTATTRQFLDRARAIVGDLDPTVPASVDILAWPGFPKQDAYARFDLLGLNSYFGWYQGDPQHETGNLADLVPFLRQTRGFYPRQALVMTEFGAEATMDGPANVKETYAFQREYLRRNLDIVRRHKWLSGAIYWTLREFAVKPAWDGGAERDVARDSIHNKGLLHYANGQPKPAWEVAFANFGSTPLYRTATPRAVSAALDQRPPGPSAGAFTVAVATALGLLLMMLAGLLVWAMRDVWAFGDRPAPIAPAEPLEPGERRLRAVA